MPPKLKAHLNLIVFLLYVFIGLIAIPRWNGGQDFSVFAQWNLFADFKPRDYWYDLRISSPTETGYFSRDFAMHLYKGRPLTWRLWAQLQNMRLSGSDKPSHELKTLIEQVKAEAGDVKIEIVRWHGPLMPHLKYQIAPGIETVWTAP